MRTWTREGRHRVWRRAVRRYYLRRARRAAAASQGEPSPRGRNETSCPGSDGLVRTGSGGRSTAQIFEFSGWAPGRVHCRRGRGSVLGVSTSGYYAWRKRGPSRRERKDEMLTEKIKAIHERSRGTYGAPRIHAELRAEGTRVGFGARGPPDARSGLGRA
ncbi:MAG: hypothetical protein BRD47_02115 [Bacteroidetes bacterium QS_8_68_28]|nr:MAG: hypothetical protein BRD47_02115 [Bacteroidetes bacterium QS_8_68_28]